MRSVSRTVWIYMASSSAPPAATMVPLSLMSSSGLSSSSSPPSSYLPSSNRWEPRDTSQLRCVYFTQTCITYFVVNISFCHIIKLYFHGLSTSLLEQNQRVTFFFNFNVLECSSTTGSDTLLSSIRIVIWFLQSESMKRGRKPVCLHFLLFQGGEDTLNFVK